MECNKEEAIRAKEMAEKKMNSKDFVGARKMVIKAQQLYPNMENISHMLTVCDVHCAAENKVHGSDPDWYGILQIEQTADEASIKKQFRKLALQLHPDKNKFPGAEAAFKLIGEAQRLLSDQTKRHTFDLRRNISMRTGQQKQSQPQPGRNVYPRKQPGVHSNPVTTGTAQFTSMNPHQQKQQTQPGFANGQQTFWTACPFCNIRYQYYRDIMNRALRCQSCMKPFIAYDLNTQGMPSGANNRSVFQKKEGSSVGGHKMEPESKQGNRGNVEPVTQTSGKGGVNVVGGPQPKGKEDANVRVEGGKAGKEIHREHKPSVSQNRKRGRSTEQEEKEESSDSCDTESSTDFEEDDEHIAGQNVGLDSGRNPRRSSRHKHNVSYKENLSDDDLPGSTKRSKIIDSPDATKEQYEPSMKGEASKTYECFEEDKVGEQKGKVPLDESMPDENKTSDNYKNNGKEVAADDDTNKAPEVAKSESNPNTLPVPDADFFDFDKDKREECFAVDQMWAFYDDLDGMPRFYARIKKVYSRGFKVQITWLEASPDYPNEIVWSSNRLPVGCGKFKHGKTDVVEDITTFSHRILWEKGPTRGTYNIYPRKGETWALFKNWNIKWSSNPDNHRNYKYEFVEVLSDYTKESGVWVAYLVKVKGFVSLFKPTKHDGTPFQIPQNELLRFSHMVPSFQTTGFEQKDVPKGYFELDPASLPNNLEEISDSVDLKVESMDGKLNCSKSSADEKPCMPKEMKNDDERNPLDGVNTRSGHVSPRVSNGCYKKKPSEENGDNPVEEISSGSDGAEVKAESVSEQSPSLSSLMDPCEIPEPEFYTFEDDKSPDKFQAGQIWAVYCELDGLPKYYAQITNVESSPEFKLNITWLEACAPPKGVIQWLDKQMPVCCGVFTNGEDMEFDSTASFSHMAKGAIAGKKNKYEIYPRKGEVWALYKNFSSEWSCSDLNRCEYDMSEVVEDNGGKIKVFVLERVSDFETVFKVKRKAGHECFMEIPRIELLRFSHQIPAFQLTDDKDRNLRGCWELDPKAMPVSFFSSK